MFVLAPRRFLVELMISSRLFIFRDTIIRDPTRYIYVPPSLTRKFCHLISYQMPRSRKFKNVRSKRRSTRQSHRSIRKLRSPTSRRQRSKRHTQFQSGGLFGLGSLKNGLKNIYDKVIGKKKPVDDDQSFDDLQTNLTVPNTNLPSSAIATGVPAVPTPSPITTPVYTTLAPSVQGGRYYNRRAKISKQKRNTNKSKSRTVRRRR